MTQEEWPRVPPKGTYVISNHPRTVLNPTLIFCVLAVKTDLGKIWVRGQHTCWFNVEAVRAPTPEEAADHSNYHPDEL